MVLWCGILALCSVVMALWSLALGVVVWRCGVVML